MPNPSELIEKLEAAETGSRELDALIWCWEHDCDFIKIADGTEAYGDLTSQGEHGHGWPNKVTKGSLVFRHRTPQERGNLTQCWSSWPPPSAAYTSSLDAILALAKRHGFYINSAPRFHIDGERVTFSSHALLPRWKDWRPDDEWFDRGSARHADQVLSVCIALLRALSHIKEGSSHG